MWKTNAVRWNRGASALVVLLAAAPLAAGESPRYVAGRAGQASAERNFGPPGLGWTIDGDDTTLGIEIGYLLHRNLAVQAGYVDLGSYRGDSRPCETGLPCPLFSVGRLSRPQILPVHPVRVGLDGYSASLVPRLPLGERFTLYGKLGYFAWEANLTRLGDGAPIDEPSDGELLLGAGAQYGFANGLGLLVEVETSDLADSVSVGTSWRF